MKILFQVCITFVIFNEILSYAYTKDRIICPPNMEPILIDEKTNEEVCDCKENFLYYVNDDSCYEPFRQGPCPDDHYLTLSPTDTIAKCVKNPCGVDGFVPYNGKCHILWAKGKPCENNFLYLGINEAFQIECSPLGHSGIEENWKSSKSCPENSYLTSTNEDNTSYACVCKPTFLYSIINNTCYEAYKQGPCPPGNYLILPSGKQGPRCANNPCYQDGLVPFSGGCYEVGKSGPPCSNDYKLIVDKRTFQLRCNSIYFIDYDNLGPVVVGGIINAPPKACPAGSRRVVSHCKRAFQ